MTLMGVLFLTLSAITPASSVFVGVPDVLKDAGTGAAVSLIAAAAMALPMAYVYAELSSAFPIAGGEYVMTGRTLGPAAGYAMLGLTTFVNMVAAAVLAMGIAPYLSDWIPNLNPTAVGLTVIAATTLMGVLHIRANAWVTGVFLALELLALIVLTVLGAIHPVRPPLEMLAHPVATQGNGLAPVSLAAIGAATSVSIYVFNGFGGAVYFAEEMFEAPRQVGRTILLATGLTILTILLPVIAVLIAAPDLKALFASENPFGDFVRARGGPVLASAVNAAVALAILNAVLATILQNARFFFSTGRDRSLASLARPQLRPHPPQVPFALGGHPRRGRDGGADVLPGRGPVAQARRREPVAHLCRSLRRRHRGPTDRRHGPCPGVRARRPAHADPGLRWRRLRPRFRPEGPRQRPTQPDRRPGRGGPVPGLLCPGGPSPRGLDHPQP